MRNESLVVVGSCDEPMRGLLRALHGGDGALRWERWTNHPLGGPALALSGDSVLAASSDRSLTAWRVDDGTLLWEITVPERHEVPQTRATTRVAATDNRAVILHGKSAFAVNARTGELLWEYARPEPVRFAGLLGLGRAQAYVTEILPPPPTPPLRPGVPPPRDQQPGLRPTTRALSLLDGKLRWTTEEYAAALPASDGAPSLLEQDGVVYTFGNGLHALDAATGAHIWTAHPAIPTIHGGSLASWRNLLVAVSMLEMGAYERTTGAPCWRVSARESDAAPGTFSSALVMEDAVYTVHSVGGQQGGYIEGRDPATGAVTMRWPDDPTTLRSDVAWRFCGADGMLFVPNITPSGSSLHAIRATDGKELWQTRLSCAADALLAVPASR